MIIDYENRYRSNSKSFIFALIITILLHILLFIIIIYLGIDNVSKDLFSNKSLLKLAKSANVSFSFLKPIQNSNNQNNKFNNNKTINNNTTINQNQTNIKSNKENNKNNQKNKKDNINNQKKIEEKIEPNKENNSIQKGDNIEIQETKREIKEAITDGSIVNKLKELQNEIIKKQNIEKVNIKNKEREDFFKEEIHIEDNFTDKIVDKQEQTSYSNSSKLVQFLKKVAINNRQIEAQKAKAESKKRLLDNISKQIEDLSNQTYLKKLCIALIERARIFRKYIHNDEFVNIDIIVKITLDEKGNIEDMTHDLISLNDNISKEFNKYIKEFIYGVKFPAIPKHIKNKRHSFFLQIKIDLPPGGSYVELKPIGAWANQI